jgi:hypothetical protein
MLAATRGQLSRQEAHRRSNGGKHTSSDCYVRQQRANRLCASKSARGISGICVGCASTSDTARDAPNEYAAQEIETHKPEETEKYSFEHASFLEWGLTFELSGLPGRLAAGGCQHTCPRPHAARQR